MGLVRLFFALWPDGATRHALITARDDLLAQHGRDAWSIVRHAIESAQRTRFALGSFVGIRRYVPEAIHILSQSREP